MQNAIEKSFTPLQMRGLKLKNRYIKTATFEGMSPDGQISQALTDHHVQMAKGGVALTTVAYGAVNQLGTTHAHQPVLNEDLAMPLKNLADAVHLAGGAVSMQLTHCGFFTKNTSIKPQKPVSASKHFNEYGALSGLTFSRAMTVKDLEQTAADFASAAVLVKSCGFDAVEVHMGHGYLLSQFLSPRINRRKDEYGGSLQNRLRFPLMVVDAIRQAAGNDYPILCKINLEDGFRSGLTISDTINIAKVLENAGVDALVMSGGYTSKTPFYLMRGDVPLKEMIRAEEGFSHKMALRLFGRIIIRKYEFSENFFMPLAKQIRQAVSMPLVYLGGVVSSKGVEEVMNEGFDMIAIGRALIHDPEFLQKIKENPEHISECNHCNICVAEMEKSGVRCVL